MRFIDYCVGVAITDEFSCFFSEHPVVSHHFTESGECPVELLVSDIRWKYLFHGAVSFF